MSGRVFHVGSDPAVRRAVALAVGGEPRTGPVSQPAAGDLIVVEAFADLGARADVVGGNAFSACRIWKGSGAAVFVVVRAGDPVGPQLARFALADGVLLLQEGAVQGSEQLAARALRPRPSIDVLLQRYGVPHAGDSQALARLMQFEHDDSWLAALQDPETGLLSGNYAALKLEEEFKRAMRFHLPLAVVLLEVGPEVAAMPVGPGRRALLAEIASVFLNECRDIDVLGRFTATTFLFALPGTPSAGAETLVQRLLAGLAERTFEVELQPFAGLAAAPDPGIADRRDLLRLAEACLARARSGGGRSGYATSWE